MDKRLSLADELVLRAVPDASGFCPAPVEAEPKLPWKTLAFSGAVADCLVLDCVLWVRACLPGAPLPAAVLLPML